MHMNVLIYIIAAKLYILLNKHSIVVIIIIIIT